MKISLISIFRSALVWLPLCVGALLTAIIALLLHYQNQQNDKAHIALLATQAESLILDRFNLYEYGLRGARGAIATAGPESITRKQFENYISTRDISREFPGALGFGFIRRVTMENEPRFLTFARQDGAPDFSIRALNPHDGDRFVIQYIYPVSTNKQAVGLDIGSETNRRKAALASARENRAYLSEPITLVQADKKARRGVLIMLPIFPNGFTQDSPLAREQNVVGWSYAPLVIDDVLAGLSGVIDQAQIKLSNQSDSTSFYVSDTNETHLHAQDKVERIINVMGQQWKLQLIPNDKAYLFHRWDISWALGIGIGFTLILVLGASYLRISADLYQDEYDTMHQNKQNFSLFMRSPIVRKTWPPTIVIILMLFSLISWLLLDKQKVDISNQLVNQNHDITLNLDNVVQRYYRDARFLANTPPIKAMIEKQSGGEGSHSMLPSEAQLLERISEVFKAYMLTSQDVFQVRLITEKSHWKEKVKVQRNGEELISYEHEFLQDKSSEPYISQTLDIGSNQVYVSDINLNREYGEIEIPHRPVWRFSTPLYFSGGTPFGILIINLDATQILKKITFANKSSTQIYITNADDDYLAHPDASKSFAFEGGHSMTWNEEFALQKPSVLAIPGIKEYSSASGRIWASDSRFNIDSGSSRYLNIYTSTAKLPIIVSLSWQMLALSVAFLTLTTASVGLQYWFWLSSRVTQREQWNSKLQLQQSKELSRFKALLESSPEATLIVDHSGIVKMVNAEAEKIFGLSRTQLENYSVEQLIPQESRASHLAYLNAYMRSPQNHRMALSRKLFALKSDGDEFPVEISLSSVPMEDGLLVSVSVRDITDRLKAEQKLTTALQEAENATRAKSAFLANTSHEIRTPLNAIIGLTHLMANENLTETQRLLIDKISLSGKSLLGIVNDVLDLSKIEAAEMSLELIPVELRDFVDEISSVFAIQAEQKKLDYTLKLDNHLPEWVETDPIRLKQIIVNLLSNALKFTDIGSISLNVELIRAVDNGEAPKPIVRFSVTDTGVGISETTLSKLFKPFSQADVSTTRRFGGTGLGLSIVSQLVALMGGKIEVKSEEGKGSVFWVDIPLTVTTVDSIELADLNNQQMLYLIVAEDDLADAKHIISLTRSLGWRADLVKDGNDLVELFVSRHEQGLRLPDALIVDWKMPNLDGLAAVEKLEHRIGEDNLPAILMVSAFEQQQISLLDSEHRIDNILQKPVSASTLFNAVNDTVCRLTGNIERVLNATSTDQIKAKWLSNTRILVVDDSDINLEVATYLLNQAGAEVETACSGNVAINKLTDNPSKYDAVLMDVQMPVLDGLEATRYIRQTLQMNSIPIIALTAGALVEERKRALDAGMNDFLTKPINPAQLISVLRTRISKQLGKSIEVEEIDLPSQHEEDWPSIDGLDTVQAKNLLMNNKELFFSTLQHLLEDNENLIIGKDLDSESLSNPETRLSLASQAHKLRSTSGMIGANQLHALASSAENKLRRPDDETEHVVQNLSVELQKLKAASLDAILEWESSMAMTPFLPATALEEERSLDLAIQLFHMFNEQDLDALTLVEQQKDHLFNILGHEKFNLLLNSTKRLNFKQAKELLEPFVQS
ncbi:CHASE domain-containing protein [Vibrio fluvialis]|nr:CHASE domain-containing protein [Vibrio fluvialis]